MNTNKAAKIRLSFNGKEMIVTMEENGAANDFMSMLPLDLTFEDYVAKEKISMLPRRLSSQDNPAGTAAESGDLTYFSPWGNLAFFYKDFHYADGLIPLGRIISGEEHLTAMDGHDVHIEQWNG